jgi:hypothetical protein
MDPLRLRGMSNARQDLQDLTGLLTPQSCTIRCAGDTEARSWRSISVPSSGGLVRGVAMLCSPERLIHPRRIANRQNDAVNFVRCLRPFMIRTSTFVNLRFAGAVARTAYVGFSGRCTDGSGAPAILRPPPLSHSPLPPSDPPRIALAPEPCPLPARRPGMWGGRPGCVSHGLGC